MAQTFWKMLLLSVLLNGVVRCQEAKDDPQEARDDDGFEQDALSSQQMRGMHSKIDANGDGKITLQEVMTHSSEMRATIAKKDIHTILDEMDSDKDGKLNLAELMKDMENMGQSDEEDAKEAADRRDLEQLKFKAADTNGDGVLDLEELPALFYPETHDKVLELTAAATLKQKDTDGDGELSSKEFWILVAEDGEDLAISEEEQADFKKLDADGSGKLSLQELKTWESGKYHTEEAMKKLFEIADKDNDMHITADELDEAKEMIAGSDAQYHLWEWAEHHEL